MERSVGAGPGLDDVGAGVEEDSVGDDPTLAGEHLLRWLASLGQPECREHLVVAALPVGLVEADPDLLDGAIDAVRIGEHALPADVELQLGPAHRDGHVLDPGQHGKSPGGVRGPHVALLAGPPLDRLPAESPAGAEDHREVTGDVGVELDREVLRHVALDLVAEPVRGALLVLLHVARLHEAPVADLHHLHLVPAPVLDAPLGRVLADVGVREVVEHEHLVARDEVVAVPVGLRRGRRVPVRRLGSRGLGRLRRLLGRRLRGGRGGGRGLRLRLRLRRFPGGLLGRIARPFAGPG